MTRALCEHAQSQKEKERKKKKTLRRWGPPVRLALRRRGRLINTVYQTNRSAPTLTRGDGGPGCLKPPPPKKKKKRKVNPKQAAQLTEQRFWDDSSLRRGAGRGGGKLRLPIKVHPQWEICLMVTKSCHTQMEVTKALGFLPCAAVTSHLSPRLPQTHPLWSYDISLMW